MYKYSYLLANLSLFLVWLMLFLHRKDVRREMLLVSALFGIVGLFVEPIYIKDWWHPMTLTSTKVGIEDFLFGSLIGGAGAVMYEEIFKKKLYPRSLKIVDYKSHFYALISAVILSVIFFGGFMILKINSFYSSVFGFFIATMIIWYFRKDLIIDSLASGILVLLLGFLWFWLPHFLTPGWVKNYWYLQNLSGILILGAPLEDLIWGFFAGLYIGPLYEFWKGAKLKKINTQYHHIKVQK